MLRILHIDMIFISHISTTFFLFSGIMKLVLLCLIFFGFCQNAQCQNNPFSGLTKVQVPKGGAKSLSFEVVAKGNVTSHIEIKAKIIQGTIHILRKHTYSTKLILTFKFFTKTVFFRQIKTISFSTLHFDEIFML